MVIDKTLEFFNGDELAANVCVTKYMIDGEKTPEDIFKRHSKEIGRLLLKRIKTFRQLSKTLYDDLSFEGKNYWNKLSNTITTQKEAEAYIQTIVNFNNLVLGGSAMQGIGNHKLYSTLSNCFVLGQPYDSYSGINKKEDEISQVMKRRGGTGLDLSTLRPKQARIHNQAGHSDGPVLFAKGFSTKTLQVAQHGRRGALMLTLSMNHPDSLDWILVKQDLSEITGANMSVKITDEFMNAINEGKTEYVLRFPVNSVVREDVSKYEKNKIVEINSNFSDGPKYIKIINPQEYWNTLIQCAHNTAEPGIIFEGNWEKGGLDYGYKEYRPISTNPCSEIPMQPYDACRLIARNLYTLVTNPFTESACIFDEDVFKTFYIQMLIADIIIDLDIEYINRIIRKIKNDKIPPNLTQRELDDLKELKKSEIKLWLKIKETALSSRRVGCGFIGLGDMLAALNCKYADVNYIDYLFKTKFEAELESTIDMSVIFGSFKGFNPQFEENSKITDLIRDEFTKDYQRMIKYGRRNLSWSTAAPTGTGSLMTQTTSGIEPLFKPFYKRRKKCMSINDRIDFVDPNDGQEFMEFFVLHPKFIEWHYTIYGDERKETIINHKHLLENLDETTLNNLFKESPWYNQTADDLDYNDRIHVQSIVQKYTTHAISSTINLPEDVDINIVSDIYKKSWSAGLKGNTVYREGSRTGILVNEKKSETVESVLFDNEFYDLRAPKRPRALEAKYHTIKYRNKTYSVIIGLLKNRPYEVFIVSGIENIPENFDEITDYIEGELIKEDNDWYNFESETFLLKEIPDTEHDEKLLSLMLSGLLRHRTPLRKIVKILEKSQPIAGSFTHKLIKVLNLYLPENEKTGEICPQCGEILYHENGCIICKSCGWTKC